MKAYLKIFLSALLLIAADAILSHSVANCNGDIFIGVANDISSGNCIQNHNEQQNADDIGFADAHCFLPIESGIVTPSHNQSNTVQNNTAIAKRLLRHIQQRDNTLLVANDKRLPINRFITEKQHSLIVSSRYYSANYILAHIGVFII